MIGGDEHRIAKALERIADAQEHIADYVDELGDCLIRIELMLGEMTHESETPGGDTISYLRVSSR